MKQLLLTTIAAVVLVGCGESQQSAPQAEPVAEVPAQPSPPPVEAKPEPPTAKAPAVSIHDAAYDGNIEAVKQHLAAGTHVDAKDEDGETPLDAANETNHPEIADLLRKHGGKTGEELK